MPVREQNTPHPPTKSRSGMFKWMISGHKGHKHKQEKLNNAVLNNKNKNNLKQQQQQQQQLQQTEVPQGDIVTEHQQHIQQQQQQQHNGVLHITEPLGANTHIGINGNAQVNSSQQQQHQQLPDHYQTHQQHVNQQQSNGDINQNVDKGETTNNGLSSSIDSEQPLPPPPSSRPPPPPSHPPPPVPSHLQGLPQPPQQPLPPVPGQVEENTYQAECLPQAPGTCTLPRRGLVREDPNGRFRSPSNPPPASRQPPPYSRHQPPDPLRRNRGPYQPPPPPKVDGNDPREPWDPRGSRDLYNQGEPQERDLGGSRNRRGISSPDFHDRRLQEREPRDRRDRRDFRETYDPKERRESRHFQEILDTWEKRESKENPSQPRNDQHRSSSLPRGNYDNWMSKNNRWSTRDPDSGFDSLNNPAMDVSPRSLDSAHGSTGHPGYPVPDNTEDSYSQSTEDLLNASRTSPDSISSAAASSVSSSPVQYPTIRPAKQPCINSALHSSPHSHGSPHTSPHPSSGSLLTIGSPHHHSTPIVQGRPPSPEETLLSDSVYPQHDNQPRYAEIPDVVESRGREDQMNQRISRDMRDMRDPRDTRDLRDTREVSRESRDLRDTRELSRESRDLRDTRELSRESRDLRDTRELSRESRDLRDSRELSRESREMKPSIDQRDMRTSNDVRASQDIRPANRGYRDTSLPREFRDIQEPRSMLEVREDRLSSERDPRAYRELSVDGDNHDMGGTRQDDRGRGRRETRRYTAERQEISKEVRFSKDPSEGLRVRDVPSYEHRDRDADGADDVQVVEQRRGSISQPKDRGQTDARRGDGATSSSVSWMEWTQQLQAYVNWVNSQLRKRGKPLISDLRRDLQSGVVFADLIEIISGERVAGIIREGHTVQSMRENLERILQFMAAKRIRMTHITSKEVAEGNFKSIMRVILALAAHYKPQSVKSSSSSTSNHHQQQQHSSAGTSASSSSAAATRPPQQNPAMHDVGVGPDGPGTSAAEKTPNLSANRRTIMTGGATDDSVNVVALRRHPSMTAPQAPARESSPVYENLPRRTAPNRWAYDSLRPSHKFQWTASQGHGHNGPPTVPPKPSLDESADDTLNTSFNASVCTSLNTSLNTSLDGDVEVSSPRHDSAAGRNGNRPGSLNFWQEVNSRRSSNTASPDPHANGQNPNPSDDPDNPFRYHTIHRMSGRRKLPQIPGAPAPSSGSRLTNNREDLESPRGSTGDSPADRSCDDRSSNSGGGTNDEGSREPEGRSQNSSPATSLIRGPTLDQWPREKKNPLDPWEQEAELKGVLRDLNNTRDQLMALQHLLQTATEVESRGVSTSKEQPLFERDFPMSSSSPHKEKIQRDSRDFLHRKSLNKENPRRTKCPLEGTPAQTPLQENGNSGGSENHHRGHRRHNRQELDPSLRVNHSSRTQELVSESPTSAKQEIIHLSIARQALEAEKHELKRLLDQRENIITELRKQMHQRDKAIQVQRSQFEDALRNLQNGKRTHTIGDSSLGRNCNGGNANAGGTREELQLVRDAIISLRSNFRGTDPNQHTLDTLEQAIAVLIERCGGLTTGISGGSPSGGGGNGSHPGMTNGVISLSSDKTSRPNDKRSQVNGVVDPSTKVIYFTERTVTPFMSTINKRLGEIRLRDFKNMFDRPGLFRFHFKSHDPEYGMVKEEIMNDDDILPGVEGKIIAWVEEDTE